MDFLLRANPIVLISNSIVFMFSSDLLIKQTNKQQSKHKQTKSIAENNLDSQR